MCNIRLKLKGNDSEKRKYTQFRCMGVWEGGLGIGFGTNCSKWLNWKLSLKMSKNFQKHLEMQ